MLSITEIFNKRGLYFFSLAIHRFEITEEKFKDHNSYWSNPDLYQLLIKLLTVLKYLRLMTHLVAKIGQREKNRRAYF